MILQNLYLHILYCKYRTAYSADGSLRSLVKTQNHHELVFIAKGQGTIVINHKRYPIRDGMILYLCPDISYIIEIISVEQVSIIAIHFTCVSINLTDGKWTAAPDAINLPFSAVEYVTEHYTAAELFRKLVDSWNGKLPGYEFICRTHLQDVLLAVYTETQRENRNYTLDSKIETIIRFMHENIQKQITLPELSRLVQLSPAYLTQSFKGSTGYAVMAYFKKIKIDRAKELLIESDSRVKDVAQALGFDDEFYFSRIFKKSVGVSPTEYRHKNVHGIS